MLLATLLVVGTGDPASSFLQSNARATCPKPIPNRFLSIILRSSQGWAVKEVSRPCGIVDCWNGGLRPGDHREGAADLYCLGFKPESKTNEAPLFKNIIAANLSDARRATRRQDRTDRQHWQWRVFADCWSEAAPRGFWKITCNAFAGLRDILKSSSASILSVNWEIALLLY